MPRTRAAILRKERKNDPDNPHKDVELVFRDVVEEVKKAKKEEKKKA